MIHTYIGEKPRHTHENTGLEDFLERLESQWGGSAEAITVIAHALWNGSEIDAVCLLPTAIVVIDFKNHGGHIRISENGPWKGDSGLVKGGSKSNPFAQVRDNKRAVIQWVEDRKLLPGCNLGHISGAVIFTQSVVLEGDLGPKISSWFHVTDLERCAEVLASMSSPQIQIGAQQARTIVDALGVREYRSLRQRGRTVEIDGSTEPRTRQPTLTEKQQDALGVIAHFLENPERKSLSVLGMTHTGKTLLLSETLRAIESQGRQPVVLAPNARISRWLTARCGLNCSSIYSHIYDRGSPKPENIVDGTIDRKRKITVFPTRTCTDPNDCVYLIDEAHLIGNDYFAMDDGKRYGSGRLADDFIEFSALQASRRQVVFFGDPYQLPRGRREAMPIFGDLQRARGLAAAEVNLAEMFETHSRQVPLANARRLAEAISAGQFSALRLESGDGFSLLSRQEVSDQARRFFQNQLRDSWFITDTNAKAAKFNHWIRRQLFSEDLAQPVVPGELLEFYYGPDEEVDPFMASPRSLASGDRLVVQSASEPSIRRSQTLKGRAKPIVFTTRRVEASSGADQKSFVLLEDFLLAEKPELDPEIAMALEVWQKSNVDQPVNKVRYGYASTSHHAQGLARPICFVDAACDGSRHSESYFRWLYTAITRATQQCIVSGFRPIDSFDEAQWSDRGAVKAKSIPIGGGWSFASVSSTTNSTQAEPLPGSESQASLRSEILGRGIQKLLEPLLWQVAGVNSVPYQEQYEIKGPDNAEVRLDVFYNQVCEVTRMRVSDAAAGHDLLISVAEAAALASVGDSVAQQIMQCARERATTKTLRVVSARRDGEYRLTAVFISDAGERAQVEINHNKDGIVSTVRLVEYTGSRIPVDARNALVPTGEDR